MTTNGSYYFAAALALLLTVLLGCPFARGETEAGEHSHEEQNHRNGLDYSGWFHDTARATKVTFTDKKNLKILGAASIGTIALVATDADDDIRDFFEDLDLPEAYNSAGDFMGVGGPILVSLGLFRYGKKNNDEKALNTSRLLAQAIAIDGVTTVAGKLAIGRRRPRDTQSSSRVFSPFSYHDRVFPSGHTSFSFVTATVLAEMYDDRPVLKATSYTTATLVGIARMSSDSHWASDVLFGAAKGYVIGKTVVWLHKKDLELLDNIDIVASTSNDTNYFGLSLRF
jgi:membrane-associated phospholipid phosphatase